MSVFKMTEGVAVEAVATEQNCDAGECTFWLPTSWCYDPFYSEW